jgi:DNA-binding LacI/PurR family transcriptional regulator
MADVATRADVSHQTVWRVVSGVGGVRPRTRERVIAAVEELGYRPNQAARRLATNRTHAIGVLAPDVPNFGPTSTLYEVERSTREAGYQPLITIASPAESAEAIEFLLGQGVEALVAIAPHKAILAAIAEVRSGIPISLLQTGSEEGGRGVPVNQAAGVQQVVAHLVELGHRRIQHLAGPVDFIEAEIRAEAFQAEVAARGLSELPLLRGDWSPGSGYRAAHDIDPTATAVFSANDQMAFGVLNALAERGVSVPRDLSIAGFDDVPEAAYAVPPLTTVRQDFVEVGRRAVRAIVAQLEGREPDEEPLADPPLVVRASTTLPR